MQIHRTLYSLLLIFTFTVSIQAKTYYVDSNIGNDGNNGLSPQTAWKTLFRVNTPTYAAGDTILFCAGSVFNGQLTPKGQGTADKPIIIDMYGGTVKPKFDGNGVTGKAVLYLVNQNFWEIRNLEIVNDASSADDRRGVLIAGSNGGVIQHVYLRSLEIHNIKGKVGQDDASKRTGGIGYEVLADDNLATRFDDMLIEGCLIYNCENTGIYTDNPNGRSDYPQSANWIKRRFTNFRIRYNVIHHISKNAMIIRMFDKGVIEYNVCYETALQVTGNTMYTASCDGAVFQYNEGYFNRSPDNDGSMYDADLKSPNTVWQYSYSHDNAHGLMWFWTDAADSGIIVRYNISQNDHGYLVAIRNDFKSAYIYNNVFYIDSTYSPSIIYELAGKTQKYQFKNNIIYNNSSTAKYVFGSAVRTIDYNMFYGKHPISEPNDNHKLLTNPQFIDPGSGTYGLSSLDGYKPKSTSPCINSGTTIVNHCDKDFWGNPVPYNATAIDRGAYEFSPMSVRDDRLNNEKIFRLDQNYPNPFNPMTRINYHLAKDIWVSIVVYDNLGNSIRELFNGYQHMGEYSTVWDGRDTRGYFVSSGIYHCILQSAGFLSSIKMVLVR